MCIYVELGVLYPVTSFFFPFFVFIVTTERVMKLFCQLVSIYCGLPLKPNKTMFDIVHLWCPSKKWSPVLSGHKFLPRG